MSRKLSFRRCLRIASPLATFFLGLAIVLGITPGRADQTMTFAWVADTRGDANNDVIDTAVLTPIVNSILALSPAPSVVIFGGDGGYRGGPTILTQFQQVFTNPLTAAGIPTAFAIGNHELYTTDANPLEQYALQRQQDFQEMFNSNWTQNGPAGFTNLAFSFHIGNSLFIIADSYYAPADGSTPFYGISNSQQKWMQGLLQNDTSSNIFVMTHIPAFSPRSLRRNPIWRIHGRPSRPRAMPPIRMPRFCLRGMSTCITARCGTAPMKCCRAPQAHRWAASRGTPASTRAPSSPAMSIS